MFNRYNIYAAMLHAAAGEGTAGGDDAAASANAPTINHDDPEDPPASSGNDTVAAAGDDTQAGGDDTQSGSGDDTQAGGEQPPMVPRDPVLKRIKTLTAEKQADRQRLAELEQENARLRAAREAGDDTQAGGDDGTQPAPPQRRDFRTDAEFQTAVRAEAQRQRSEEQFALQCQTADQEGEKRYGVKDWETAVDNLKILSDDNNVPAPLLQAALTSDDPAKVLFELGKDPAKAQRLMSLPPAQRIAEAVKMGIKTAPAPKPQSRAPAPIDPIGGAGGHSGDGLGDDVDDETWLKNRQAQLAASRQSARN